MEVKIIEQVVNEKDFDKLITKFMKFKKSENVETLINLISKNKNLTSKEKKEMYSEIFDYVGNQNLIFFEITKKIYLEGCKDTVYFLKDKRKKEEAL